jgi:hypothetical protein
MKRIAVLFSLLAAASIAAPGANAATELTGFSSGAFFRIVVPDASDAVAWNGSLVLWNHGFSLSPIGPVSDLGPLAALQLAEGYAVAASSYQQDGWAVFKTNNDLRELLGIFKANFGQPDEILVTGGSLGGAVTAAALERGNLGHVTGAMSICGALGGSRNWDGGADVRLIYDVICADVPGAFIPGGAEGLPAGVVLSQLDVALAANACFGVPFGSADPMAPVRLAQFLSATKLPVEFLLTDLIFATDGLGNLVHDPAKLDGHIGVTTVGVEYADPLIDAEIARVSPNPGAANRLHRHFTPNGDIGSARVVSLHTDKDGLVIVENESEYASVVPADQLTTAIAVENAPSHCGFSEAEVVSSWESLRAWVGGAAQPSTAQMQGLCQQLEGSGLALGPCRIDPAFVIPDMDGRVPPR